jgi:hypothetical protein
MEKGEKWRYGGEKGKDTEKRKDSLISCL